MALARVCQALAGNPSRELRTIGITGSAGKTVTAMLVASIFEAAGEAGRRDVEHRPQRFGRAAGADCDNADAAGVRLLAGADASRASCRSAVLELSSQALADRRASGIELDAAILTNIQERASDRAQSRRCLSKDQRRIFRLLKAGGMAIVNADDHRCRGLMREIEWPMSDIWTARRGRHHGQRA